ncbi:MAG: lytic transglycosylase domain-containing protein [Methylocystaceae bacterium]|nr:MAG: lytic transglycosylase domain-containing protein [Methylocystaceae bacterium]
MTFQAIASADRGATEASAPRWPRFLQVLTVRLRAEWPDIRAAQSVQVLVRALAVAAAFAFAMVAVLLAVPDGRDRVKPAETSARTARNGAQARGRAAPPVIQLARGDIDDTALDADFSLEEAARSWARVAGRKGTADRPDAEAWRGDSATSGVLQFGPVRVARAIVEHVVQAAKTTGSDPALLMAIADKESNFAPRAKASTSSASGLFQFIDSTWFKAVRLFGWRHGQEEAARAIEASDGDTRVSRQKRVEILKLRNDPYLSAVFAAEMLKYDGERISERLGRPLTAGETYLIHFLGPDDAARFMQKMDEAPNTSAARLLPKPARANKPIFYARQGRKMKDKSVGEVHEAFEAMMGQRSDRYRGVESKLPGGALAYTE